MTKKEWLLLLTQLPATPSSLRVNVWRRLKNIGATSYQNGTWIMPRTEENETYLKRFQLFISENKASSQLFVLQSLDDSTDEDIIENFRSDREEEYHEVLEQCVAFSNELREESENRVLTFIELEDNEQKIHRLENWIAKIHKRDFLDGSSTYQKLVEEIQACRELLRKFTYQVYEKEGIEIENPESDLEDDDLLLSGYDPTSD